MMRSSFIVASALASGVLANPANGTHMHDRAGSNNDAAYASAHEFEMPKRRMDETGKSGKPPWTEFGNRDCIGLGIFFSTLSDVVVRVQCEGGDVSPFCRGDLFGPACGDYRGPPKFYLCKDGECVEQRTPVKP